MPTVAESRRQYARFREAVEEQVRRHQAEDVIVALAHQYTSWLRTIGRPRVGVDILADAMESACVFQRRHRDEPVSRRRVAQILNAYGEFPDPCVHHLLSEEKDLPLAMRIMHRQQLPLQAKTTGLTVGRTLWFAGQMENSFNWFRERYGCDFYDLFRLLFSIYANCARTQSCVTTAVDLEGIAGIFPLKSPLDSMLSIVARSRAQVRDDYLSARADLHHEFLGTTIETGFLRRPLIRTESGGVLSPFTELPLPRLIPCCIQWLKDECPDYASEAGDALERYVCASLESAFGNPRVIPESEIPDVHGERVTDAVVELDSTILVVECKATQFDARMIAENPIRNANSTTKIASAIEQIDAMSKRIRRDGLNGLIRDKTKPIRGVVVTLGEVPMVSSEWYWSNFLQPRFDADLAEVTMPLHFFDASSLDWFTLTSAQRQTPMDQMIASKDELPYIQVGEWDGYLQSQHWFPNGIRMESETHPAIVRYREWGVELREDTAASRERLKP